jgi:hypothetical protein
MPNYQALQVFYGTLLLVGAILLANWSNNKRLDDLKTALNARIDDLKSTLENRLTSIESRLSDVERGLHLIRT